jgi:hypothetical protein
MAHSDWNVRKIAVEVIYTLSVLVSGVLTPYKHDILQALNECRFDKVLHTSLLNEFRLKM